MSWYAHIAAKGSKPIEKAAHPPSHGSTEQPKVIVSESRLGILKCCTVHLMPILATIIILSLNLHGHYIGHDFQGRIKSETINRLLLQVAAKVHEVLIGTSLALIVLDAVRYELVFGNGLPLGLVGAGLAFDKFQYFTKKEFGVAVKHWFNNENTVRKVLFVGLLLVSGLIATLSGPASATLLVPKSQEWPKGGTEYFLNGPTEDFWPVDISGDLPELQQICGQNNSAISAVCPAGGFVSLWEHWGRTEPSTYSRSDVRNYAKRLSGSTFYWPIHSPASQVPPRYVMGGARIDAARSPTYLVLPHAAPAIVLQQTTRDWWKAVAPNDDVHHSEIDDRQAYSRYLNAITSVRCSAPQNLSSAQTVVDFPTLLGRFDYAEPLGFNVTELSQTPANHLRFRWVHLPDDFGAISIGAIFESPWVNNASRVVVGCSAQAGWVPAQTTTDEYTFWTGWYPWNVTFGDRLPFFNAVPPGQPIGATNGRIAMGDTWLDLLTPRTTITRSGTGNPDPTTIESIFENADLGDLPPPRTADTTLTDVWKDTISNTGTRVRLVEAIICSTIVDGLSRYGSHRAYTNATDLSNLTLSTYHQLPNFNQRILAGRTALAPPPLPSAQYTTLDVTMKITGFSFKRSLAGTLSMIVLTAHLVMATAHIGRVLYTGQTSSSWTLISELIAIAHNSRTTAPCLQNTGAAIHAGSTFGHVVRIVARSHPENPLLDKVELVFDDAGVGGAKSLADHDTSSQGEIVLSDRRSSSISKASIGHAFTWEGPYDTRAYTSSSDRLVPLPGKSVLDDETRTQPQPHFDRVRVNRAYC